MNKYINQSGIVPILTKLSNQYDILYDAHLTNSWSNNPLPENPFPIELEKSCFGYERLIVEFISNDAQYVTVDLLNPIADMKFCAYCIWGGDTVYYKQMGCQINSDGTKILQYRYVGEIAMNDSTTSSSRWYLFNINKVIGIKNNFDNITTTSTKFLNGIGLKQIWDSFKERLSYKVLYQNDYLNDDGGEAFGARTVNLLANYSSFKRLDIEAISDDEEHFFVSIIDPRPNKKFGIVKATASGSSHYLGCARYILDENLNTISGDGDTVSSRGFSVLNNDAGTYYNYNVLCLKITKVIGRYTY